MTPNDIGKRLRVTAEQVRCLIRKGELAAINVGTGPKRPLYRITPQALDNLLSRRYQPGRSGRPRRASKRHPLVPDFFADLR